MPQRPTTHIHEGLPTAYLRDIHAGILQEYHDIRIVAGRWEARTEYAINVKYTRAAQLLGANTDPNTRYRIVAGVDWEETIPESMFDIEFFANATNEWTSALDMMRCDKALVAAHQRVREFLDETHPMMPMLMRIDGILAARMQAQRN